MFPCHSPRRLSLSLTWSVLRAQVTPPLEEYPGPSNQQRETKSLPYQHFRSQQALSPRDQDMFPCHSPRRLQLSLTQSVVRGPGNPPKEVYPGPSNQQGETYSLP